MESQWWFDLLFCPQHGLVRWLPVAGPAIICATVCCKNQLERLFGRRK